MTMLGSDHLKHLTNCPLEVETDEHLIWSQLNHAYVEVRKKPFASYLFRNKSKTSTHGQFDVK